MLRLTDIKLPLDHAPLALRQSVSGKLKIADGELLEVRIAKRSYDARQRGAILLIYTLDVSLRDEARILARFAGARHAAPAPDTNYRSVAQAPANLPRRP